MNLGDESRAHRRMIRREARNIRRLARQLWPPDGVVLPDDDTHVTVRQAPYDWDARGDFAWHVDHDPIHDWDTCPECSDALRRSFVALADLDLGPNGSGELVARLRGIVAGQE